MRASYNSVGSRLKVFLNIAFENFWIARNYGVPNR
jgi:hypothetical protein